MSATPATSTQTQAPDQATATQTAPATTEDKPAPAVINKKRIQVRKLPFNTNRAELEELASSCGRVMNVEVRRGFGFVTFESTEDAEYAIYKLQGKAWRGAELQADYAKDVPKTAGPGAVKKVVKAEEKKPKAKREELTLKFLTPPNPATQRVGGAVKPAKVAPATDAATTETAAPAGQTAQAGQPRRGGRGGARGGAARGGATRGRGGRGRGRGGRGGNFSATGGQPTNGTAPAPAAASTPAAAPTSTPAASSNHPAPTAAKRGGKKGRGGKAGNGKFFEITVKDAQTGAVTHTLHMTEAEVQQFVQPLLEKVKA